MSLNELASVDPNSIWDHKGHHMGDGMVSQDGQHFYVNIPKNASSFIKSCLESLDFKYSNIQYHHSATPIVVLRDPIDRWVSGIYEYLLMYHVNLVDGLCEPYCRGKLDFAPLFNQELLMAVIFDRITFDDHTERQVAFLQNIDLNKSKFLIYGQNFSHDFSAMINTLGYKNSFNMLPVENGGGGELGTLEYKRRNFKTLLNEFIDSNQTVKSKLLKWFELDYQLLQRVK